MSVLLFMVCSLNKVQAQEGRGVQPRPHDIVKVNLGLKAGIGMNKLDGDTWSSGYRSNLHGGAYLAIRNSRWGIHAEFLLSQSTFETSPDFYSAFKPHYNNVVDSIRTGKFRLNYVSVPILLRWRLIPNVWALVGPQWSGVMSVNDKNKLLKDPELIFKDKELSGVLGLWVNISPRLHLGARYVIGLTNNNNTTFKDSWHAKSVQLHLGWGL